MVRKASPMKNRLSSVTIRVLQILTVGPLFFAATSGANAQPAPQTPKIVYGGLTGHQVCGNFATGGQVWTFACNAMPNVDSTAWQLTPLYKTNGAGAPAANKAVIIRVATPLFMTLYVEYENDVGARFPFEGYFQRPRAA